MSKALLGVGDISIEPVMSKTLKEKEKPAKRGAKSKCFNCDGTGYICNECGKSERACKCETMNLGNCEDCKGSGR